MTLQPANTSTPPAALAALLVAFVGAPAAAQPLAAGLFAQPNAPLADPADPARRDPAPRALPLDAEVLTLTDPSGRPVDVRLANANDSATPAEILPPAHLRALDPAGLYARPLTGYTAHARVLLRATDEPALRDQLPPGAALTRLPGDTFAINTDSVRDAHRLARALARVPGVEAPRVALERPWSLRATPGADNLPIDDRLADQWHLINTRPGDENIDLNADAAWAMGYTGLGVTVGVVELGFREQHPDLFPNYDPVASQNFNFTTSHGTSVAGLIAAAADGDGTVGLAYNARLSQQLIGDPAETAAAYAFRNDINDIKNHSYGPADNALVHNWDPAEAAAVLDAVTNGRAGRGAVFVWAAGNGGAGLDRIDYDPYASSRYTIAISGHTDADTIAPYAEPGSALVAVAPSSGQSGVHRGQTTTSYITEAGGVIINSYTSTFGFTSGSAPLGAAVVALMLEANPDLTWLDVQHALINSLRPILPGDSGWTTNAAGRRHHERLGFGALDAAAAVQAALDHIPVGAQLTIDSGLATFNAPIPDPAPGAAPGAPLTRTLTIDDDIEIDHVELVLTLDADWQGDVSISLAAPSGTVSTFATTRPSDFQNNINNRVFTSFKHWGERANGEWTLTLRDGASGFANTLVSARLLVHGACRPADLTGQLPGSPPDGQVTLSDLAHYLNLWAAADPAADLANPALALGECPTGFGLNRPAGDGVNLDDFLCYLSAWAQGCPPATQ